MKDDNKLTAEALYVGGRYPHRNGSFVREIDEIRGDCVYWHDQVAPGQCSKERFLGVVTGLDPSSPPPPMIRVKNQRFTKAMRAALRKEAEGLDLLLNRVALFRAAGGDQDSSVEFVLGEIAKSATRIQTDLQRDRGPWPRVVTYIDQNAEALEIQVGSILSVLRAAAQQSPAVSARGVLHATDAEPTPLSSQDLRQLIIDGLSAGLSTVGRIRGLLIPVLGR